MPACRPEAAIERLDVTAYTIPTDGPDGKESDGTLTWEATTIVLVEAHAGGEVGLGYTYADVSAAHFVESMLVPVVQHKDPFMVGAIWRDMMRHIRNVGRTGVGAMAVSAVDVALHDLRAKLLGLPLFRTLGAFHETVPIYGSGGFCNYGIERLVAQLSGWVAQGIPRIKLKTSRQPSEDPGRLNAVRAAVGDAPLLMTDANGALSRKQALYWAHRFREEWGAEWYGRAGVVGRSRRLACTARSRPTRARHRRRRVWVRGARFRHPPRRWSGGLSAGRREPLLRHHWADAGGRSVLRVRHRSLGALRSRHLCARLLRGRAPPASRVLSRPRAHRVDAIRRRALASGRSPRARSLAARFGTMRQAAGRRALSGVGGRGVSREDRGQLERFIDGAP